MFLKNNKTLNFINKYIKEHRGKLYLLYFLVIISSAVGFILPLLVKDIIDEILPAKAVKTLHIVFISIIALYTFKSIVDFIKNKIDIVVSETIVKDVKFYLLQKIKKKTYSKLSQYHSGYLFNRISSEVDRIDKFITMFYFNLMYNIVSFLIGGAIIIYFSPLIFGVVAIFIPVLVLPYIIFSKIIVRKEKDIWEENAKLETYYLDYLRIIPFVHMLKDAPFFNERVKNNYEHVLTKYIDLQKTKFISSALSFLLNNIFPQVIFWLGFYMVIKDELTLGVIIALQVYIGLFLNPLSYFVNAATSYRIFTERVNRISEIVSLEEYDTDIKNITETDKLFLDKVSFKYVENEPLLENINFELKRGAVSIISGSSGSGKSTMAKLVSGLLKPQDGSVGDSYNTYKMLELQNLVHYVPQNSNYFEGTVMENIVFDSSKNIKDKDYDYIKRWTEVLNFTFPLDKVLTENGNNLSGGEKQKISILRALYFRKPFMIFDESFSQIDEKTVKKALEIIIKYLKEELNSHVMIISHNSDLINSVKIENTEKFILNNGILENVRNT